MFDCTCCFNFTCRAAIRCLDLSCTRRKLSVVDEQANVVVYDVQTREKLFEDKNANSVAWNGGCACVHSCMLK